LTVFSLTATLNGPIVCGVDFSDPSRRALQVAIVLARQLGLPLTVITVVHPLLAHAAEVQYGPGRFTDDTTRDLEKFVADSVPAGATWMPATRHLVTVGDSAPSLLDSANAARASIVVVGTRGLGRAKRLLFGSTTARILRDATQPVLAVPDHDQPAVAMQASAARLEVARLLCAVDLDEASVPAARAALDLGRRLAIPVTLLHAVGDVTGPEDWAPLLESTSRNSAAEAQAKLAQWLAQLGEQPDVIIKPGMAAEVLIAEVAAGPPAWVVIGVGAPGRAPGSTATQVLVESHAPVFAVPPV
jgi:nucleotide-binding universal stress UspA family protein